MEDVSCTCGGSWPDFPPQVCEEDNYHVSWAVKLVHRIYNLLRTAAEKFRFIQQLESMFSMVTMEMLEFSVTGGVTFDWEARLTFHDAFCLFFPWIIIDVLFVSASRKCVIKLSHGIHRVLPGNNVADRETLQSLHFFLNSTARFHAKLLQMFVR